MTPTGPAARTAQPTDLTPEASGGPAPPTAATDSAVWTLRVWRESGSPTGMRARITAVTMDGISDRQVAIADSVPDIEALLRDFLQSVTGPWAESQLPGGATTPPIDRAEAADSG